MNLEVRRTYDPTTIREVMTHPDIFATVAEDGQDPGDYKPDVQGSCWLRVSVDDETIGLYVLHAKNCVTLEIHTGILHEYRKEYSRESIRETLRWVVDNVPEYQKIIAWVPTIYPNVKNFALRNGFRVEGVNRNSFLKNGEIHDQWLLGITKDGIKEYLNA
jgi:RimJ/RimL family protein N-acetyltransferase